MDASELLKATNLLKERLSDVEQEAARCDKTITDALATPARRQAPAHDTASLVVTGAHMKTCSARPDMRDHGATQQQGSLRAHSSRC